MRRQTRFLPMRFATTSAVRESDGCDRHQRERLIAEPAARSVTGSSLSRTGSPTTTAFRRGLRPVDENPRSLVDIVATDAILGSGFHERLHTWWPGLEEIAGPKPRATTVKPVIVTPPDASTDEPWWTCRDREEELVAIARQLKADRRDGNAAPLDRTAVVFKAPLPYLYLAAQVFGAAGIPCGRPTRSRWPRADRRGARPRARSRRREFHARRARGAASIAAFRLPSRGR
jgi:hypothetical protein